MTDKVFAAAYMTGILPIKKDGSQSAISEFREYTMLYPDGLAPYVGFTENEVKELCIENQMDFDELKMWYDGYEFAEVGSLYNPYSVMMAVSEKKCRSYWKKTSAAESLMTYVRMDFDGLQEMVTRLIGGEEIPVKVDNFENDLQSFKSKDDVLTLLAHLGYLAYNEDEQMVRIPNAEVRIEFEDILSREDGGDRWIELISKSQQLLRDTINGDEKAVAEAIESIRESSYAPTFYNNEQALRYVIKFAYIACVERFVRIEELPSGKGIADIVFIPKKGAIEPAMVIELKWDGSGEGAIDQIHDRKYPKVLEGYGDEILLVGINYSSKEKKHFCRIEKA